MKPTLRSARQRMWRVARKGFTLAEVVVAAVILAVLAAITVPQIIESLDKQRVQETYDVLLEIQNGITNTLGTGFIDIVRSGASATNTSLMPGSLSQLDKPIISAQYTTYPNSCGANASLSTNIRTTSGSFSGANAASGQNAQTTWTLGGPFIHRVTDVTIGLAVPIGQIQNTILRTITSTTAPPLGATGATVAQYIRIRINNVDSLHQVALDLLVDGVASSTTGRIWYNPAGGTTVDFAIPVPNRC